MLIDAHQHFWQVGRHGFEWPTPDLPIHRDFTPAKFLRHTASCGVDGTIVVQAQPNALETEWLLELARTHEWILGVVGWVDLAALDAPCQIARLAKHPKLRGIRPMLQNLPDDEWIARPEQQAAIRALIDHDLALDALVYQRHLPALLATARSWPDLRIVIDHCAKPPISEGRLSPWLEWMAALAELPNVYCKLSGLLTELPPGGRFADIFPYAARAASCFGDKLIWGSDWPVICMKASYRRWFALTRQIACDLGLDHSALFAAAAAQAYDLQPTKAIDHPRIQAFSTARPAR